MNSEEIIRMAQDAGLYFYVNGKLFPQALTAEESSRAYERFAELVAAAEREACAKVAETAIYRHDIADAIRKRKEESEC
jgi:hypothetical protein